MRAGALVLLVACGGRANVAALHVDRADRPGALHVPILMYHRVGPASGQWPALFVSLPVFARQMAAISRSGVVTATVEDVFENVRAGRSFDRGVVTITLDDGTLDQFVYAWPVLKQYGIHATFYIAPGLIGRPGYMTWGQLNEIAHSGLGDIEAHTMNHADLTGVSTDRARAEIDGGRRILEQRLGIRVRHFAYPFGHTSVAVASMVRDAGYETAVTTAYGVSRTFSNAMSWGRIEMHDENTPSNLATLAVQSGNWAL